MDWIRVRQLFEAAKGLPSASRAAFLDVETGHDREVHTEVLRLLGGADAPGFLAEPLGRASDQPLPDAVVTPLVPGDLVVNGRYAITEAIGAGASSWVYLATDRQLTGRKVVVKVLRMDFDAAWTLRRFQREVELLAKIDHPGVVTVLDQGTTSQGTPCLVMQHVKGSTLRELMVETPGPWAVSRVVPLVAQMARALAAAHREGITHRDLRPENVIVRNPGERDEQAVIIDFGIATAPRAGDVTTRVSGTPEYMAPEQMLGRPVPASDIYSLGAVAFELLTGRRWCATAGASAQTGGGLELESFYPTGVPAGLKAAVARAVCSDIAGRCADALAFGQEVERYQMSDLADKRIWRIPVTVTAPPPVEASPAPPPLPQPEVADNFTSMFGAEPPAARPSSPTSGDGFTGMFAAPSVPPPAEVPAARPVPAAPPPPAQPAAVADNFTSMFGAESPAARPSSPTSGDGFTGMFAAPSVPPPAEVPAARPVPAAPPPPAQPASVADNFTSMFGAEPPAARPSSPTSGDGFTGMFAAPVVPPPAEIQVARPVPTAPPLPSSPTSGDGFTGMFAAPVVPPPAEVLAARPVPTAPPLPSSPASGDGFTGMFAAPVVPPPVEVQVARPVPAPPPLPSSPTSGDGFTGMFAAPVVPPPVEVPTARPVPAEPPPPAPPVSGDGFTRLFAVEPPPPAATAPAAPSVPAPTPTVVKVATPPPVSSDGFTRMFAVEPARPVAPSAPPPPKPAPHAPPVSSAGSNQRFAVPPLPTPPPPAADGFTGMFAPPPPSSSATPPPLPPSAQPKPPGEFTRMFGSMPGEQAANPPRQDDLPWMQSPARKPDQPKPRTAGMPSSLDSDDALFGDQPWHGQGATEILSRTPAPADPVFQQAPSGPGEYTRMINVPLPAPPPAAAPGVAAPAKGGRDPRVLIAILALVLLALAAVVVFLLVR